MTEHEQIRLDIKRKLNSYQDLNAERRQLLDELARLDTLMTSPSGPNLSGMPRSSGISNRLETFVAKSIELEQRYREQLEKLAAGQAEIEKMIEGLDPTERLVARFRYIDGLTWEKVCDQTNYSWSQTHRIHGKLLEKLVAAEIERRNENQ